MIVEITVGIFTGSMALLADGWHMGTHAFALGISCLAYVLARKYRQSENFSFGTGKFSVLGGYTSAIILGMAGGWMIIESMERIFNPVKIDFSTAILVTVIGLTVNLVSVLILNRHDNDQHDPHEHTSHDHNYQAVYYHVIADALTSILALAALVTGRYAGWAWLDPLVGIIGGVMIGRWAWRLLRATGMILLDSSIDRKTRDRIRELIEANGASRIADLHLWQIGSGNIAAIISVVTGVEHSVEEYHRRLSGKIDNLKHVSIEVNPCEECTGNINAQ
jgi:cation diffusion facilitator family transporter